MNKTFAILLIFIIAVNISLLFQNRKIQTLRNDYKKKYTLQKIYLEELKDSLNFFKNNYTDKKNSDQDLEKLQNSYNKIKNKKSNSYDEKLPKISQVEEFIPDNFPIKTKYFISKKFSKKHPAIDISTQNNNTIFSAGAGVIQTKGFDDFLGNFIIINHLNGYSTLYSHLKKNNLKLSRFIKKNEALAKVGLSGNTSGPHLHFEIIKNNEKIDPLLILKYEKEGL